VTPAKPVGESVRHPELLVQLTKRADGAAVLRAVRRDGSATWQRQNGSRALFFPFHDLTHFAVETTLGLSQGFFGLIADGWDIEDTEGKGTRGPLPHGAALAEHLVGLFDRERMGGAAPMSAAEFNAVVEQLIATKRIERAPTFTDAQLAAVRQRIEALHGEWAALAPGAALELRFDRNS
jgi:hypothetical protein